MKRIPLELCIWVTGLLFVAIVPPLNFSICIFHHLGFKYCPGCGLGHSIYYLVHGDWQQSIQSNPFGIFAIAVLVHRIYQLINQYQTSRIKSTQ